MLIFLKCGLQESKLPSPNKNLFHMLHSIYSILLPVNVFSNLSTFMVLFLVFSLLFAMIVFDDCRYDYKYNSDMMLFYGPYVNKNVLSSEYQIISLCFCI